MFALIVLSVVADGRDQQLTMLRQYRGCSECTLAAVRLPLVGHNSWSLLVAVDRHGHPSLLIIVVYHVSRSCPAVVVAQDRHRPRHICAKGSVELPYAAVVIWCRCHHYQFFIIHHPYRSTIPT